MNDYRLDSETKFINTWMNGKRERATALKFIAELKSRLAKRTSLSTDDLKPYLEAVEQSFGNEVDYRMILSGL